MVKIDPATKAVEEAERPDDGGSTVEGTENADAKGEVTTDGDLDGMMETYNEIKKNGFVKVEDLEPLLPSYAWIQDGKLKVQPPTWSNKNHGLTDLRKDILRYRAAGYEKTLIPEMLDCGESTVLNACRVFSFMLTNEEDEWTYSRDATGFLLKKFVGGPKEHPEYPLSDGEEDKEEPTPKEESTASVTTGTETVTAKVTPDKTDGSGESMESTDEPESGLRTEALGVAEVMDRSEWRETVRMLLNSEEEGSDEKAEMLMSVLTDGRAGFE